MNERERVLSVLNGKKPDMVPWFGDLDYWIDYLNKSNLMPDKYKTPDGIYKLHQDLGVGFYLQGYFPFKNCYDGIRVKDEYSGDIRITTVETPIGNIREIWQYSHMSYCWGPKEFFVKDINDLKVLRYWYEHTYYEPDYKLAEDRREIVGDHGLVLCYTPKSPFMELVALKAGIEAVTFAAYDDKDELEETLNAIERKHDEASRIAIDSPAECLMIPENLSAEMVGKVYYEKYMKPYEEKWIEKIRDAGKYSFIHMDGTLRGLIREVSLAGFNVLEALTLSPVGDIEIGDIKNWVCNDTIIWGGIPGVYFTDNISDSDFERFVIGVLEIMRKDSGYVLGVADQIPPKARFERIKKVSELVEKYGRYE